MEEVEEEYTKLKEAEGDSDVEPVLIEKKKQTRTTAKDEKQVK